MTRELTDTNDSYPDKDIPDGTYTFKVLSVEKKYGGTNKDKPFFVWKVEYEGIKGEQVLMPNMMGDLLRTLKCKEDKPGHFDWETDLMVNQQFEATVTHEMDKGGKVRQRMGNFKAVKEELPF